MKPRVSIVMPSYNHAQFVGQAIQSVFDQSFQDFEIVVTDDASTDGTPDIIRQFSDPRIRLEVFEQNQGACFALNSSIRRSQGEFLCYLASDDYFLPEKIAKQVAYLEANPRVGAVFGLPMLVDERGMSFKSDFGNQFAVPFDNAHPSRQQWLRHFFFNCNCLCAPTAMIRRSCFDDVGLYDPRLANLPDFDLWIRICVKHEIHVMQEELTAFRIRDGLQNMSAPRKDTALRHAFEYFQILKHYRKMPRDLVLEIFAQDLAAREILPNYPHELLLAEFASMGKTSTHALFALDTAFEVFATLKGGYDQLIELTGKIDVFNLAAVHRAELPCPCGSGKKYKICHGRLSWDDPSG